MSITECPRCGWNRANPTGAAHVIAPAAHESVVSTDEISLLEDQVHRLDEEISRLNEERAAVLRRINRTHSMARYLPPEILSTIFQFVSPPFNFIPPFASNDFREGEEPNLCDEMFQYSVAAVSYLWREAAISTPQLWTSLSLGIHPSYNDAILSSLNFFSQRAQCHPMTIELDFRDQPTSWSDDREESLHLMEPIKEAMFVDYADRIQSLRLIEPPTEWFSHLKNLSRCDTLAVARPSRNKNDGHIDFTELPSLRHVVLVYPRWSFSLPRSRITTLYLLGVPCIVCMELLITCPSLVEFEMYSPSCGIGAPVTTNIVNGPITLEQIEYLTWSNHYCDCLPSIRQCIGYLRFSKLRALQWYGDNCCYPSSDGTDHRLDFFSNLPITLSSLTFYRFIYSPRESMLQKLLSSIPQLRELHFIDCNTDCVESIINAVGRLLVSTPENAHRSSDSEPSRTSNDETFLPHLSNLTFARNAVLKKVDGHIFVDMLEALRASGTNPKQFQLTINSPHISWNTDVQHKMRILVAFGFSVKIGGTSMFS